MFRGRRRLRTLMFAAVALVGIAFGTITYATEAFRSLELNTVDTRFSVRGEEKPPKDIVVVGVDAFSFAAFGDERWPFTHDLHAEVVRRLKKDGAKVIAFDIQFSEPSNTDEESLEFLDAIQRARNVAVSTTEVDDLGNGNAFTYYVPLKVVNSKKRGAVNDWLRRELHVVVGEGSLPNDPGGILRRVPYETSGLKSFAVSVAERASGRRVDPDSLGGDTAWIDYYGPPGLVPEVHYSDVHDGKFKPGTFRNKIVVVGATAPVLQDVHGTATSGDDVMSGPEIQATAVETALNGFPLQSSPTWLDILLIVAMGLVAPVVGLRWSALRTLAVVLVVGAVYAVVVQIAFNNDTVMSFVYAIGALTLSAVGALAVHYVTEAFERERTRDLFSRFVPESVVGDVLEQADGARLGGVSREATVMFSDLRGFTSFAESLGPDEVIAILNRYLKAMVDDAILPHGGTLVDYMGDGIMAVFGAPIQTEDHADRALAAARDKLRELVRFNEWLHTEMGVEKSFQMGIGLNSGRVMSGNVGSERRLAYTAIGDTTNTAARLEAMTKGTPYMLFLSDSTRESLSQDPEDLAYVDEFEVRGREAKVKIWSVDEAARERFEGAAFESVAKAPGESKLPAAAEPEAAEPAPAEPPAS
jgi:adenylate cyclase